MKLMMSSAERPPLYLQREQKWYNNARREHSRIVTQDIYPKTIYSRFWFSASFREELESWVSSDSKPLGHGLVSITVYLCYEDIGGVVVCLADLFVGWSQSLAVATPWYNILRGREGRWEGREEGGGVREKVRWEKGSKRRTNERRKGRGGGKKGERSE